VGHNFLHALSATCWLIRQGGNDVPLLHVDLTRSSSVCCHAPEQDLVTSS